MIDPMLERDVVAGILTLRMARGKVSALDLELCRALQSEVETAAESHDVRAIILTGTGSTFSAGVDLIRLTSDGKQYVQDFVESLEAMLRTLFLFPKPAVAAMNGHAIAGGAIIAFACDYRLMSGGRIGVPEALVGVPFPPLALEVVRYAVPKQYLQQMLHLARVYETAEAKAMGIVDEVVAPDHLLARATLVAKEIAEHTPDGFRITKRQLREPFLRDAAQIASVSADEIEALWADPTTHAHIKEYLAKTIRRT